MTTYPTDKEVAELFLLYKLGKAITATPYEVLAEQEVGWPVVFLDNEDITFLATLGVRWSDQPRLNTITTLLGEHFVDMNVAEVSLEFLGDIDYRKRSVVFSSLKSR